MNRRGYLTTEFWGKLAVQALIAISFLSGAPITPEAAMGMIAGLEGVYALIRGAIKTRLGARK